MANNKTKQTSKSKNKDSKKKTNTLEKDPVKKTKTQKKNNKSKSLIQEQAKIEIVGKELKGKNKIPKQDMKKIYNAVLPNIYIAIGVIIYFIFMILGFYNINNKVFVTDLKAFSIFALFGAIVIFEYAYKKNSIKFAIYGIEVLIVAILTMLLIYINLMYFNKFAYISSIISFIFAVYYVVKCVIIYKINKKEYFMGKMKKIINKDEE